MIYGEDLLLTSVLAMLSTDVVEEVMEITTSIPSWVENSPQSTHTQWNTEEFKLKLNFPRETGSGLPSGCSQDIINTDNGLQVEKSISCKVEETSIIQDNLEEDLKPLHQLCTGDQISSPINTWKLMPKKQQAAVLLLTTSIPMVSTGMTKLSTHISIVIQIEFSQSIIHLKATGTNQESTTETIPGNTQRIKMLPLIENSIWFST